MKKYLLTTLALLVVVFSLQAAITPTSGIVYIKQNATGDGSSWVNAAGSLADALQQAATNGTTQIWVAEGTYKPEYKAGNGTQERDKAFILVKDVKIYGGFKGNETSIANRSGAASILSGDIGTAGNNTDNCYHVVIAVGNVGVAELNGFTITGGNANGGNSNITVNGVTAVNRDYGGGIHSNGGSKATISSPIVTDCVISANMATYGAGMYNTYATSSISGCSFTSNNAVYYGAALYELNTASKISNCNISENSANSRAGAIYNNSGSSLTMNNCVISKNTVVGDGGALYAYSSSMVLTNCLLSENTATGYGGVIYNENTTPKFINSTIAGNKATRGCGGLYGGSYAVANSIIFGNTHGSSNLVSNISSTSGTYTYSLVGGQTLNGTGNLPGTFDPLFVSATDLHLQRLSLCINSGNNAANTTDTDLDGKARIHGGVIDLGAYEYQSDVVTDRLYVTEDGAGDKDGSSWANAMPGLAKAFALVTARSTIKEIWVKEGTYKPEYMAGNGTLERDKAFVMVKDVKIYGGFKGNETAIANRSGAASILSGDIGTAGVATDNCYHVVIAAGPMGTAELNGFTITGGNANVNASIVVNGITLDQRFGGGVHITGASTATPSSPMLTDCIISKNTATSYGSGIYNNYASPVLTNCTISANSGASYGGGLFNNSYSNPVFNNCTISANTVTNYGGGMYNESYSKPVLTNSVISDNTAAYGGGIYNYNSSPVLTNCMLLKNNVTSAGGGIYSHYGAPALTNCTISGNKAGAANSNNGGGLYIYGASPTVTNTIIYGNTPASGTYVSNVTGAGGSYTYSLVGGQTLNGTGNLSGTFNPLFVSDTDLHLSSISPCINSGNNSANTLTVDLEGNPRIFDGVIDLGACEYQEKVATARLYVTENGANKKDGSSWDNAAPGLAKALACATGRTSVKEIWVAEGTYKPEYIAGNGTTDRDKAFVLAKDVKIYGGFKVGETAIDSRTGAASILSGNIGTEAVDTDNCYHVVIAAGPMGTAELNGFTITGGNANVNASIVVNGITLDQRFGGGVHITGASTATQCSPAFTNCVITENKAVSYGGGVYTNYSSSPLTGCTISKNTVSSNGGGMFNNSYSTPALINCVISKNTAASYGGGLFTNTYAKPVFTNCAVSENTAAYGGGLFNDSYSAPKFTNCEISANTVTSQGGGMYNSTASPNLINCVISKNIATSYGGGLYNNYASPVLTNCTISGNKAGAANTNNGGGLYIYGASPTVTNTIIYGNTPTSGTYISNVNNLGGNYSYSLVGDQAPNGTGNLPGAFDPLFVSADDLRLQSLSPCINSGNNAANATTADLDGNDRIYDAANGGVIDLGAYEYQGKIVTSATMYVTTTGAGDKSGSSWDNAFPGLAKALAIATGRASVKEIWVAEGTYKPEYKASVAAGTTDRDKAFILLKDVKIYGGFKGNETAIVDRSGAASILSGDIGTAGVDTDNCYHVVIAAGPMGTAELNGFTITGGNANVNTSIVVNGITLDQRFGGGVHITGASTATQCSPAFTNCVITENKAVSYGGGVYTNYSSSTLTGCTISKNTAPSHGGGMFNNSYSTPALINCAISKNTATSYGGGFFNNTYAKPVFTNCTVSENTAGDGGGMYNNTYAAPKLTNCTVAGNKGNGGGLYNSSSTPVITNTIIYGNTTTAGTVVSNVVSAYSSPVYTYSLVGGQTLSGTGNLSGGFAPLFVSATDLHLQPLSLCINSGNNAANTYTTVDMDGNPRVYGGVIDLGAYEFQSDVATDRLYVTEAGAGNKGGASWDNAVSGLSNALAFAATRSSIKEIWVKEGTYKPEYMAGNGTLERDKAFVMVKDVKIYGGFKGDETAVDLRHGGASILSGDIDNTPNNIAGNSFHVVVSAGPMGTAELNGFTIKDGNANDSRNIIVNGVSIEQWHGGGMHIRGASAAAMSSPVITNCTFLNNTARSGGGIISAYAASTLTNCLFSANTADYGGGVHSWTGALNVYNNCTIAGNKSNSGGGLHNNGARPLFVNTIIHGNTATNGAVNNLYDVTTFTGTYTHCLMGGQTLAGTGNLSGTTDPMFVDAANGDWRLHPFSFCINSGNNSATTITADLAGNPRIYDVANGGIIDLGAYEYQGRTSSGRLHVTVDGAGDKTGSSWENAIPGLAKALAFTTGRAAITEIWVAEGTYKPEYMAGNGTTDRDKAFVLTKDVKIYGGFKGDESALKDRSGAASILSGDIGTAGVATDNCHHVVIAAGAMGAAELDGFIITGGNANGSGDITVNGVTTVNRTHGGGVYNNGGSTATLSSLSLKNCVIKGNATGINGGSYNGIGHGGGLYTAYSSATIANCSFSANTATNGGGVYNGPAGTPYINNCSIAKNTAQLDGAGMYNDATAAPKLVNCSIVSNSANYGGAMFNYTTAAPKLINCSIVTNTARSHAGAIYNYSQSKPVVTNTIVSGNTAIYVNNVENLVGTYTYSLVEGQTLPGTGNLSGTTKPLFVDAANGDLRLHPRSRCINKGDNTANTTATDLDGDARIYDKDNGGIIDLGAYEYQGARPDSRLYVTVAGANGKDGSSWNNAMPGLAKALNVAKDGDIDEIWVAEGVYYPEDKISSVAGTTDRDKAFLLATAVKIYGGFRGDETAIADRSGAASILSGDIGTTNDNTDNCHHVVVAAGDVGDAELNGFTITGGNANVNTTIVVNGATLNRSYGGGLLIMGSAGNISAPVITNCSISGNRAIDGGGMLTHYASAAFTNCVLSANTATNYGGGVDNYTNSSNVYTNCTISGNNAQYGGGLWDDTSTLSVTNSIIHGNTAAFNPNARVIASTYTYSLVGGVNLPVNAGNLSGSTDPMFKNAANGDLTLNNYSRCINKGNNTARNLTGIAKDLAGKDRIYTADEAGIVDMGAYEYQGVKQPRVMYVTTAGEGDHTGSSWDNAVRGLANALDYINNGTAQGNVDEIWVAEGTYKPEYKAGNGTQERDKAFVLAKDVAVYGGFKGDETKLADRHGVASILSGDIGTANDNTDNCYHVVIAAGEVGDAGLNGFTITGGNASANTTIVVNGITIRTNEGAGINISGSGTATPRPMITNCIIRKNQAFNYGGGAYVSYDAAIFTNCRFQDNNSLGSGGGLYTNRSSDRFINCQFSENSVANNGGGLYIDGAPINVFINCAIVGNKASTASSGGGLYYYSGLYTMANTIIHSNTDNTGALSNINNTTGATYTYSLVGGQMLTGEGNLPGSFDPMFADAANGDWSLQSLSPCINSGNNEANTTATDLAGKARIYDAANGGVIDMGTHEYQAPVAIARIYVTETGAGTKDGTSWTNAVPGLAKALASATGRTSVKEIWVAGGTYKPDYMAGNGILDRDKAFVLVKDVKIYGGFAGDETTVEARHGAASILSGEIGVAGIADNCYHVVLAVGDMGAAELNGFTVKDGNANSNTPITVNGINTNRQFGGGVQINGGSTATVSSFILTNCIISDNYANYGGGLFEQYSSPLVTNCVISKNSSLTAGGGVYNNFGLPVYINCSIFGNKSNAGGGFYTSSSTPTVTNTIIYGNTNNSGTVNNVNITTVTYTYSLVGGQTLVGEGNLSGTINPLFVDADNGDLRLQAFSRCVNSGNNAANTTATDLDGKVRIYNAANGGVIDLGAYEYQGAVSSGRLYVTVAGAGDKLGSSWDNAIPGLSRALYYAAEGSASGEIWVAEGTYKPEYKAGNGTQERDKAFVLVKDVKIYGGFAGTEETLDERNGAASILSGDIGTANDGTDNCYHVVLAAGNVGDAELNGFTVTAGSANTITTTSTIIVNGVTNICRNYGGGILITGQAGAISSPVITNCIFSGNIAYSGGGLFTSYAAAEISNCLFTANTAVGFGGGIDNWNYSSAVYTNCTISANHSNTYGGGLYNHATSAPSPEVRVINTIIYGNTAPTEPNAPISGGTYTYSLVGGQTLTGEGNLPGATNPLFVSATDLHLQACSPCVDKGDNSDEMRANYPVADLGGNVRIYNANNNGVIDLGAYETIATPLTLSITQTDILCKGAVTGAASATVSGGTGSYTYAWTSSTGTGASVNNLPAGTHTCTVTDVTSGCQTAQTFTIKEPAASLTVTPSQTNPACNGALTGVASVAVSGGTGDYTYVWSPNGGTAATATGLAAGTYSCTITDANGCSIVQSFTIIAPAAMTVTSSQTNVSCKGGLTGAASVAVSGGTAPYTYAWSPSGGAAATATGLGAGEYTCTIIDVNGCQTVQSFTIIEPAAALTAGIRQNKETCVDASNGEAEVFDVAGGTAPYTYKWTSSTSTGSIATGLSAGSYSCTITDAMGCTLVKEVEITGNPVPTVNVTESQMLCSGDQTAAVTFDGAVADATYNWTNNNPGIGLPASGTGHIAAFTATNTGTTPAVATITVTPSANGCQGAAQTFTITVNPNTQITAQPEGGVYGAVTNLSVTATGTGTLSYAWSDGSRIVSTDATYTPASGKVAAGRYAVTVSGACGSVTSMAVIVEPKAITVTATGGTSTYGDSPVNPGLAATGLATGEDASVLTGLSNSFGILSTTAAGTHTLTVAGTLTNANYTVTNRVGGSWTVNAKSITVTATGGTSTYGDSPVNPGFTATGLVNSEPVSVLTGLSNSFGITATTTAGTHALSVVGVLTNANYTVTNRVSGSWTVNAKSIIVTATGGTSTYGDSPVNPGFTATGLVNSEPVSVLTGLSNSFGIVSTTAAGIHTLTVAGTLTNANYTVTNRVSGSWTVNAKSITVTATGGTSTYGDSPVNPGFTATGLMNGEDKSVLTGLSNSFGIIATTAAGTHTLTVAGTLTNANYTVTNRVSGSWTVNAKSITVTATGGTSTYGDSPVNPGFTATGLVNSDPVSVLTGLSNSFGITAITTAGTHALSVVGVLTNANYTVTNRVSGNWTVNAKSITVTATGGTSTYGDSPVNPGFTATGLVNSDPVSVLTGLSNSFGIIATTAAGSHTLTVAGTLTNANYTVTNRVSGSWTVNAKSIIVTATGGTSTYGDSPVNPGFTATGLVNSEPVSVLTGLSNSFGIVSTTAAGTHTLTVAGTLTNANYTVTNRVSGSWTVNAKSITVTALGGSSNYGDSPVNPGFTATGLVNGETESVLTGLSNSFGINATTAVGVHTLTVAGTLTNANYSVTSRANGAWTVNAVIRATAGANGRISPAGESIVAPGGSLKYTLVPDAGYRVENLQVNGESLGFKHTHTFANVMSCNTIHAAFTLILPPVVGGITTNDDVMMQPAFDPAVKTYQVILPCAAESAMFQFTVAPGDTIIYNGDRYADFVDVTVYKGAQGSLQIVSLSVENYCGSVNYVLNMYTPYDNSRLVQPYDNMLEVINNPALIADGRPFDNNGFYQWYLNDRPIAGANKGILYAGQGKQLTSGIYSLVGSYANGERNKVCPLSVEQVKQLEMYAYPNPTTSWVTVKNAGTETVRVYDMVGKLVKMVRVADPSIEIDLSDLPAGIYLLSNGRESVKVLKN